MAECEEELKRLLTRVKEESEKASLKLNIQKTKIMAFSPITSWQIDGETMETVTDLKVKSPSRVRLLATPLTAAYQAPPSMGFSRQEYWSEVPLPSLLLLLSCFSHV